MPGSILGCGEHPNERLLDGVVRCRGPAHPGADDPTELGDQPCHVRRGIFLTREVSGAGESSQKTIRRSRVINPARRCPHQ
jgi:hypothetical protein